MRVATLTADPELRFTPSGRAVVQVRLAINTGYRTSQGEWVDNDATFLDGKKMKLAASATRRDELAKFIINSPYFSKVSVNRTWGHFFGRGMTKDQVDDFGEHNPVTFPEMLEKVSST